MLGNIYLADINSYVYRFKYTDGGISSLRNASVEAPRKISTYLNSSGRMIVYAAAYVEIVELDWTEESYTTVRLYEFPKQFSQINDVQGNSRTVMLQSEDSYYFYRYGETLAE